MSVTTNINPPGALERWAGYVAAASSVVSAALLLGMFGLINLEIALRYVFNTSSLVADEYAGYMFAGLVYLGLNQAIHSEKLIAIDMPGIWGRMMDHPAMRLFRAALMLGLNLVLVYAAVLTLKTSMRFESRSIQYSKTLLAIPQSVVVIGLALACFASLALLVRFRVTRT